jgi:hypothetical protein
MTSEDKTISPVRLSFRIVRYNGSSGDPFFFKNNFIFVVVLEVGVID